MKKSIASWFVSCLLASAANAEQFLGTYHVKRLFSESGQYAGFYSVQGFPGCLYDVIDIDLALQAGRAQLALLTTAKATNSNLPRIDYTKKPDGSCWLDSLHVE